MPPGSVSSGRDGREEPGSGRWCGRGGQEERARLPVAWRLCGPGVGQRRQARLGRVKALHAEAEEITRSPAE